MSNLVPKGWSWQELGGLFDIAIGGTPSRSNPEYWDSDKRTNNRWLSIRDLKGRVISDTSEYLSDEGVKNSNVKLVPKGTVIMSFKLSVGRTAYTGVDLYTNEAIVAFFPKDLEQINLNYFYQGLHFWDLLANVDQAVKGVTLNKEKINLINALLPSLPEQQKIAKILTSVDEVIEKTQAKIDKLKDLKTGVMQELLTNGIGHTEFKDSPVGRIPAEWEVVTLGDVTIESAFGPRFSSDEYAPDGNFGCIRTTDMDGNWDINYSTAPLARLNFKEFEKHILVDGDLLVTRSGTCGIVDVYREQPIPMVAAAFLIRFRLTDNVIPQFLKYLMMSTDTQESVQLLASGGVQKNLSGTSLKTLKIPKPSIQEQIKIVKAIESINNSLANSNKKLSLNKKLKKALMQDLLTGNVRVKL